MSRLIDQLGSQYLTEFCRGALIVQGDWLFNIRTVRDNRIMVHRVSLEEGQPDMWDGEHEVPTDLLDSFSSLAWPKLGYRNLENNKVGNLVCYVTANRSVFRGLHSDQLSYENLPIFGTMGDGLVYAQPSAGVNYKLKKVFRPKWITYKDGMSRIRAGDIAAFALNEDVAISLSATEGPDRYCDIYFRQRVAGEISQSGEIVVANKIIKRSNLKKLSEMLTE